MIKKIIFFSMIFLTLNAVYTQVPAGNRKMGINIDQKENEDYDTAFQVARDAGMQGTHKAYKWSDLEPEPNQIGGATYESLADDNAYFYQHNTFLEVNIPVINTTQREVPSDLTDEPFDSPLFIRRFKTLLDSVFSQLTDVEIYAFNIGNESDIYFEDRPDEVAAYKTFFDSVKIHAENLYFQLHAKDLNVGSTLTWGGLTDSLQKDTLKFLISSADIISVNYYPINDDFTVRNPSVVREDFNLLISLFPDTSRPIIFPECGYPSSETCLSSEQLQSDFYDSVFVAWDEQYDHIKYIGMFTLTDWSQWIVDLLALYYGITDEKFKEYLRTLGLRNYPETEGNKLSYYTVQQEAQARGFTDNTSLIYPEKKKHVTTFVLTKNYPNPFNSSTIIEYNLTAETEIKLTVFNTLGEKIKTLVNARQPAGRYRITFDGSNLPSGVYLYEIQTGQTIEYRKMILIR